MILHVDPFHFRSVWFRGQTTMGRANPFQHQAFISRLKILLPIIAILMILAPGTADAQEDKPDMPSKAQLAPISVLLNGGLDVNSLLRGLQLPPNLTDFVGVSLNGNDLLISNFSLLIAYVVENGGIPGLPPLQFPIPGINGSSDFQLSLAQALSGGGVMPYNASALGAQITHYFGEFDVSDACLESLAKYYGDYVAGAEYAKKMVAAFGQPPTENAKFDGLTKDWGNWWQCISLIKTNGTPSFDSQYCAMKATLSPEIEFEIGTCFPDTCSDTELNTLVSQVLQMLMPNMTDSPTHVEISCVYEAPWRGMDVFVVFVLCVFGLLVLIGSLYDVFVHQRPSEREQEREGKRSRREGENVGNAYEAYPTAPPAEDDPDNDHRQDVDDGVQPDEAGLELNPKVQVEDDGAAVKKTNFEVDETQVEKPSNKFERIHGILIAFSAVSNGRKILSAKKSPSTIGVINGLRVLSMFWIILGHSVQFQLGNLENPIETIELGGKLSALAIGNATVSVDTFFVMSGFLVTLLTLRALAKADGKLNWVLFYFHRWWRLTPVYMITIAIWATLVVHFGQGIYKVPVFNSIKGACDKYWWTHIIYINNLIPFGRVLDQACMGWGWYLACDMQFYVFSPLIITLLYKHRRVGMLVLSILTVVSLSILLGIVTYFGYSINPTQGPYNDRSLRNPGMDYYYAVPYTRINTYFVGMALGYLVFLHKDKQLKVPIWAALIGWCVALTTMFAVVYGTWANGYERYIPQAESVLYLTFGRFAWSIAVAWIIFACVKGYGGPINVFLGWRFWIPLGRLTYCAYLIHPIIIFEYVLTTPGLFHVDYFSISYFFVANVVFSYVAALILSLLVEGPTMGLEKVMFGKKKPAKK